MLLVSCCAINSGTCYCYCLPPLFSRRVPNDGYVLSKLTCGIHMSSWLNGNPACLARKFQRYRRRSARCSGRPGFFCSSIEVLGLAQVCQVISKLADYVCDTDRVAYQRFSGVLDLLHLASQDDPRASLGAPSGWPDSQSSATPAEFGSVPVQARLASAGLQNGLLDPNCCVVGKSVLPKFQADTSTAISVESCESALRLLKAGTSGGTCIQTRVFC